MATIVRCMIAFYVLGIIIDGTTGWWLSGAIHASNMTRLTAWFAVVLLDLLLCIDALNKVHKILKAVKA